MTTLSKQLRTQLENTVKAARDVAENAAKAALAQLAVGDARGPDYQSELQRVLRRRLRAHPQRQRCLHLPARNRYTILGEDCFCLILVDFHDRSIRTACLLGELGLRNSKPAILQNRRAAGNWLLAFGCWLLASSH